MKKLLASLCLLIAAMASALLGSTSASATVSASAEQAVLVSASGNTGVVSEASARTPYPWGYYATREACEAAGQGHMADNPGAFYGYYCVKGTGANRDKWQLYMDERDCTDRVTDSRGLGSSRDEHV